MLETEKGNEPYPENIDETTTGWPDEDENEGEIVIRDSIHRDG